MNGDHEQHAANREQPSDCRVPPPPRLAVRPTGHDRCEPEMFDVVRWCAEQHPEVGDIQHDEDDRVHPAECGLQQDHPKVQ